MYFEDAAFRDYFDDEQHVSVIFALTTGEEKNADVMTFTMPKCLLNSASKQMPS